MDPENENRTKNTTLQELKSTAREQAWEEDWRDRALIELVLSALDSNSLDCYSNY